MEHCVPLASRPRRDAILHAIAEHDNGWAEGDAAPSVNPATGQIFDFISAPIAVRQGVWPRGVARLAGDPWADDQVTLRHCPLLPGAEIAQDERACCLSGGATDKRR